MDGFKKFFNEGLTSQNLGSTVAAKTDLDSQVYYNDDEEITSLLSMPPEERQRYIDRLPMDKMISLMVRSQKIGKPLFKMQSTLN